MPMRIIGCGNIDRGDDGAGLLVARRLREMGTGAQEQSGEALSLIESWAGAEDVIVVDAVVSGKAPGEITVWDARAHPIPSGIWRGSTHDFGLAEAVELARVLDRLPARLWIYGIEGRRFEQGSRPSPEVTRAIEEVAERIARGVTGAAARLNYVHCPADRCRSQASLWVGEDRRDRSAKLRFWVARSLPILTNNALHKADFRSPSRPWRSIY